MQKVDFYLVTYVNIMGGESQVSIVVPSGAKLPEFAPAIHAYLEEEAKPHLGRPIGARMVSIVAEGSGVSCL